MNGDYQLAWSIIEPLIWLGLGIGLVMAIMFGAIKLGWTYAPWLIAGCALVWFLA